MAGRFRPGWPSFASHGRTFGRIVGLLMGCLLPAFGTAADTSPPSVLILDQSGAGVPGHTVLSAAFQSALLASSRRPLAVYLEYLNFGQFGGPQYEDLLTAYMQGKYKDKPIELIVTVGSLALEFALRRRIDLWSGVPIVFAGVDAGVIAQPPLPAEVTGTTLRLTLRDSATIARALVPNLRRIVLVGDPLEPQTLQEFAGLTGDLELIGLLGVPINELKTRVASLPENTAIVYAATAGDGGGSSIHLTHETLAAIAAVANRPIVVAVEAPIALASTGGLASLPITVGQAAGRQALRILGDQRASDHSLSVADLATPVFDGRELRPVGIGLDQMPAGSEVRFHQLSMWELYRTQIIVALAVVLFQSIMIAALLLERRRRYLAELESRQRMMEMAHMDRVATAGALSASIAHELNQPLGAILNNAEAAELILAKDAPNLDMCKEILADIRRDDQRAADIIKQLRGLMKKAPLELQEIDLNDAVREVLRILAAEARGKGVVLSGDLPDCALPVRADPVHLQQVLLNIALNGMDAMARCDQLQRRLSIQTAMISDSEGEVSIADTGPGIPPEKLKGIFDKFFTTKPHGIGLGLSIARTIVETYGGQIWAENRAAGGAVFRFTLPLAEASFV